jgi:biotin carboxyl carrier protein
MNNTNFDAMGKVELRAACKAAGVVYGKLNNDGMRAALKAKQSAMGIPATVKQTEAPVKPAAPAPAPAPAPAAKPAPVAAPAAPSAKRTSAGVKVEKGRDEQNGVKRPSAGTICRDIWDALDKVRAESKDTPSFADVHKLREARNWQKNTAVTQYQRWKQFHGLMPRGTDESIVVRK